MFVLNKDTPLTEALLQEIISRFTMERQPQLIKYKNYYDGAQAILKKYYSDESKPCNRTVTNYCSNVADMFCGYIATPGYISYTSNNNIDEVMEVLRYNDYQAEDSDFLLSALVYGTAAELVFNDEEAKARFNTINPTECFGIFDNSLTKDLLYFVRFYKADEWANDNKYCIDVYDSITVKHYESTNLNGSLQFISEEPHYFNQCPAIIFNMPDEKSVFDCIIPLQDSYNEILTSEIDDYSAFVDAFLVLYGVDADADDIASMKENRVLVLPQDAKADWLTKNASDNQVENLLKRIHDSIYRTAQCPDFSNDTFNTAQSGIAIRFKLTNMETRASRIAALMKKALQRRVELICGMAALKLGEEVFRDIAINFKRNIPEDINATVNLVNQLKGIVSDSTLIAQLPFVSDAEIELETLKKEREEQINLYDFGGEE